MRKSRRSYADPIARELALAVKRLRHRASRRTRSVRQAPANGRRVP